MWVTKNLVLITLFYNFTIVHNGNSVGKIVHNSQVMAYKEASEAKFFLELLEELKNSRLNRNIQSAGGFVCNQ